MDRLLTDLRFAARSLAKSTLFTVVALASLALGIGANVTVFSIVSALALKPLPYADADRLVDVSEWSATKLCSGCGVGTSYPGYVDWRASARSFSAMGGYLERPFAVSGKESAERVGGALVSAGVFEILGVRPALGRAFIPADDRPGAPAVVILGDALWTTRFASNPAVIGSTVRVNGIPHVVIGVMPPRFAFPEFAALWVPLAPNAAGWVRDDRSLGVVARLAPGSTMRSADAEMAAIARSLAARHPAAQAEWTARVSSLRSQFGAMPTSMYVALLGAVLFVLLIVCANLAGLLLARGAQRQREIGIRLAIGATRAQIVRHLLMESTLLAVAGGGLGMLVALWGVDLAAKGLGAQAPFYVDFALDGATLAYCAAASIGAGVAFGLFPALRASAADVHSLLKEGAAAPRHVRARGTLVIGQLALALVLLAGAAELTKSFLRISAPAEGYDAQSLLTADVELLDARYRNPDARRDALGRIAENLRRIPGAAGAALDHVEFIAGFGQEDRVIRAEGVARVGAGTSPRFYHVVTPGYFETLRLPIVAGRDFGAIDRAGTAPVVIVNSALARSLWPEQSPLGRRIKLGDADTLPWRTIVGVVSDVRERGRATNYAYVPVAQASADRATILVRARSSDALRLAPSARAAVHEVDGDLPVLGLQTVESQRRANYWPYRMYALVMAGFAAFAILLAAIGLYGVIAYNVAQRTREIGVRMALGAEARDVVGLVARQAGRLVVLGVVLGVAGSALLLRALGAMLFGASPVDIPIFAAVSVLLALVSLAAIALPARRAAKVDPLVALRAE